MRNRKYTGRPSLKWLFEDARAEVEKIVNAKDVPTVVQDLNKASPEAIDLLKKGQEDQNTEDDIVPVAEGQSLVGAYKPTQNEISLMKSVGYPLSSYDSLKNIATGDPTGKGKPIVTSDRLVIDGHHRWSSIWAIAGKKGKVLVKNVRFPGTTAGEKLAKAQIAIAAKVGTPLPVAPGSGEPDNILGAGAGGVESILRTRVGQPTETGQPLLGDEYLKQVIPSSEGKMYFGLQGTETPEQARELIIKRVSANLGSLPGAAEGSPARALMPQFDPKVNGPTIDQVVPDLTAGNINLKSPVSGESEAPQEKEPAAGTLEESHSFNIDRWQILAGIKRRG